MKILTTTLSCNDPLLGQILPIIRRTLGIIQIIVPILLILGIILGFTKLVINPDDKKEPKQIANRIIAAFVVFLLPFLINYSMIVLSKYANVSTYNISTCWVESDSVIYTSGGNLADENDIIYITDEEEYESSSKASGDISRKKPTSSGTSGSTKTEEFMTAVANVISKAQQTRNSGSVKTIYGNSSTVPPVEVDNPNSCKEWSDRENGGLTKAEPCYLISCDRLAAKALWNIGYTDQPAGGITIGTFDSWFRSHNFNVSTNEADAKRGSIMLVGDNSGPRHAFVIAKNEGGQVLIYDAGSNRKLDTAQPFAASNIYNGFTKIYGIYNLP